MKERGEFEEKIFRTVHKATLTVVAEGSELYKENLDYLVSIAKGLLSDYIPEVTKKLLTGSFLEMLQDIKTLVPVLLEKSNGDVESTRLLVVNAVKRLAKGFGEPGFKGHFPRTATIAKEIARELGYQDEELKEFYWGGLLHDVGKVFLKGIRVPKKVSEKPLERDVQMATFRAHSEFGALFLEALRPLFERAVPFAREHQEEFDGKGYPFGITYKDLTLEGKIAILSDLYEARSSRKQVYRERGEILHDFKKRFEDAGSENNPLLEATVRFSERCHDEIYGDVIVK